jgi:hypothetical protein
MNTEYKDVLEEINKLEALFNPPPIVVSELQTFQAKMRYLFDNFLYQRFHDLSAFVEYSQLPNEKKSHNRLPHVIERAAKAKEELKDMFFSHHDYWNFDEKTNLAIPLLEAALRKPHYGECIGINQLCERCCAEITYHVTPTKTWTNERGIQMYQRLQELKQMEAKLKLAQSLEAELISEKSNNGKTKI